MVELTQFSPRLTKWGFKIQGKWKKIPLTAELTSYLQCEPSRDTWWIQTDYLDYRYGTRGDDYEYSQGRIYVAQENLAILLKLKHHV